MARSPGRTAVKEAKKGHGSRVFNIVIIWVATIYLMSLVFNIRYLQSRAIYRVSFDVSGINPYAYIPGVANLSILGFLLPLLIATLCIIYLVRATLSLPKRARGPQLLAGALTILFLIILSSFSLLAPGGLIAHDSLGSGGSIAVFYMALFYMLILVLLNYRARTIVATLYLIGFVMMLTGDISAWAANPAGIFGAFGLADGDFLIPLWLAATSYVFCIFSSGKAPYRPLRVLLRKAMELR